jgi:hypothetical protein
MRKNRKRLNFMKDVSLMLSMFFLPFGYDFLFKMIMDVTSYWTADLVFYTISGMFMLTYLFLRKKINDLD